MHIPEPRSWAALTADERETVLQRPAQRDADALIDGAAAIVADVRARGDTAVRELTRAHDGVELAAIEVGAEILAAAAKSIPDGIRTAIEAARSNVERFHAAQRRDDLRLETAPGVVCERQWRPLDAVGLYVPGGSAPLPSAVIMLAVPAQLAAVPLRVLCSPPGPDGEINRAVLAAAHLCGVHRVFRIGGAQAIAAMAFGTGSVPRVVKLFGPGNQWVTAAKALVSNDPAGAACDMPAGPSELMVIADAQADPKFVAADLLSQAEHGPDSQVILVSDSAGLAGRVVVELQRQAASLPRRDTVAAALAESSLLLTEDLPDAVTIANRYAPEHLILNVREPRRLLAGVRNAGSVFLGAYAPESVGDYCSGTNHVLPTYGWARSYSGLTLDDFLRSMTVQELTPAGLARIGPVARTLAQAEGLDAHARAVTVRMNGDAAEEVA